MWLLIVLCSSRSSLGFRKYYPFSTEKEARDKFLVLLARGVKVTRHQSYKHAEPVTLFSTTGCRSIQWEKPGNNSHQQHHHFHPQQQPLRLKKHHKGCMKFWCTRKVYEMCLSGISLINSDLYHVLTSTSAATVTEWCCCSRDRTEDVDPTVSNRPRSLRAGHSFWNAGFKRHGMFQDLDLLQVYPATHEDPDCAGNQGSETLRNSRDVHNAELTFVVVYRDQSVNNDVFEALGHVNNHNSTGSSNQSQQSQSKDSKRSKVCTLDIECDSLEMYHILLTGFDLLTRDVLAVLNKEDGGDPYADRMDNSNSGNGLLSSSVWRRGLAHAWQAANSRFNAAYRSQEEKKQEAQDPVRQLFAGTSNSHHRHLLLPSSGFDPLHALVHPKGGNLLLRQWSPFRRHANRSPLTKEQQQQQYSAYAPACDLQHGLTSSSSSSLPPPRLPIAQFLGWSSAGTQIWARLKMAGLEVKVSFAWDLRSVLLKVRCPKWRLEQMAQQMHLKLRTRDGYLRPFRVSRRDSFMPVAGTGGAGRNVFKSSERQQIIDYILRCKIKDGGAELDEHTELGQHIVQRFPLHMYSRLIVLRRTWVTFWKQETHGQIAQPWSPFSVSYRETFDRCTASITFFFDHLLVQPIDSVAEYFGESIAFYFAFLTFYTRWLIIPSIVGVIVFAVQMSSGTLNNWLCAPYAVLLMVWICLLLAYWRQKESALAYRWGVLDYEVEETERAQFQGTSYYDSLTQEWRKSYAGWKRALWHYSVSIPVIFVAVCVTLVVMTTVFYSQYELQQQYNRGETLDFAPKFPSWQQVSSGNWTLSSSSSAHTHANSTSSSSSTTSVTMQELTDSDFWAATFFYPCLYGMLASILTMAFEQLALVLNEYENHKTQTIFMNRLILKVFSFQFVAIFTSLYYYAFFSRDQEDAYSRIGVTIFSFMTVGQWWNIFLDVCLPSLYHRALVYGLKRQFATINRRIFAVRAAAEEQQQKSQSQPSAFAPHVDVESGADATGVSPVNDSVSASRQHHQQHQQTQLHKRIRYLDQAQAQCWQEALQSQYNNFNDYTDLVIQISFLLFFGAVFPLAPLLALLNNLLLIRVNALKLCYTRQRPIAQKAGGIGVWADVLQILSVGGALTQCALLGFVASPLRAFLLPLVGETGVALVFFAYEQLLLLFKYWLHTSIPRVAPTVLRAQLRERKSLSRRSFERATQQQQKKMKKRGGMMHKSARHVNHSDEDEDGGPVNAGLNTYADQKKQMKKKGRKKSSLFNWLTGVDDLLDDLPNSSNNHNDSNRSLYNLSDDANHGNPRGSHLLLPRHPQEDATSLTTAAQRALLMSTDESPRDPRDGRLQDEEEEEEKSPLISRLPFQSSYAETKETEEEEEVKVAYYEVSEVDDEIEDTSLLQQAPQQRRRASNHAANHRPFTRRVSHHPGGVQGGAVVQSQRHSTQSPNAHNNADHGQKQSPIVQTRKTSMSASPKQLPRKPVPLSTQRHPLQQPPGHPLGHPLEPEDEVDEEEEECYSPPPYSQYAEEYAEELQLQGQHDLFAFHCNSPHHVHHAGNEADDEDAFADYFEEIPPPPFEDAEGEDEAVHLEPAYDDPYDLDHLPQPFDAAEDRLDGYFQAYGDGEEDEDEEDMASDTSPLTFRDFEDFEAGENEAVYEEVAQPALSPQQLYAYLQQCERQQEEVQQMNVRAMGDSKVPPPKAKPTSTRTSQLQQQQRQLQLQAKLLRFAKAKGKPLSHFEAQQRARAYMQKAPAKSPNKSPSRSPTKSPHQRQSLHQSPSRSAVRTSTNDASPKTRRVSVTERSPQLPTKPPLEQKSLSPYSYLNMNPDSNANGAMHQTSNANGWMLGWTKAALPTFSHHPHSNPHHPGNSPRQNRPLTRKSSLLQRLQGPHNHSQAHPQHQSQLQSLAPLRSLHHPTQDTSPPSSPLPSRTQKKTIDSPFSYTHKQFPAQALSSPAPPQAPPQHPTQNPRSSLMNPDSGRENTSSNTPSWWGSRGSHGVQMHTPRRSKENRPSNAPSQLQFQSPQSVKQKSRQSTLTTTPSGSNHSFNPFAFVANHNSNTNNPPSATSGGNTQQQVQQAAAVQVHLQSPLQQLTRPSRPTRIAFD